jgi:bifunctional enzyme CysN/CysC
MNLHAATPLNNAPTKDLLRFITCGSVDDGKSTLIGRLLHDSKLILDDQLLSLAKDSVRHGTTGGDIDFALLVDGLEAERQQGITIDVAYRYFGTPKRSFIVADTPGHEQYTRNMATGASNAELAIILIDARKGVLTQTRRHSLICSLLGIKSVIIAVNKIDLVNFDEAVFDRISREYGEFAKQLDFATVQYIPLSARFGDNIIERSVNTIWYSGPTLLDQLETISVEAEATNGPLRFPVQWVNRPNQDFRGYAGTVVSGQIKPGDLVTSAGASKSARVKELITHEESLPIAQTGDAITITLMEDVDLARGDVIVRPDALPEISDQFAGHLLWMTEEQLFPGRSYLARIGTKTVPITATAIKYKINVNTQEHLAASTLGLNDIGFCNFSTSIPVAFDTYHVNRRTGSFILIDRNNNNTVGAGLIAFSLRRSSNIQWQPVLVSKVERAQLNNQKPAILWFTGLSGAGKSTIANLVEQRLYALGYHTMLLDGDNVRHGLNRDLGFTEADRVENIRRAGEVAKLMTEAGLIVICSFISPYRAEREMVRRTVAANEFLEVFVDTPIEECIRRDPKGLYAKAKAGMIKNFTGLDSAYEAPKNPDIHLMTTKNGPEQLAEQILQALTGNGLIAKR